MDTTPDTTPPKRQKTGPRPKHPDSTRLFEIRQRHHLTQAALAGIVGVTQRAISKFEVTGKGLGATHVLEICRRLEVDIRDLIPETSAPNPGAH